MIAAANTLDRHTYAINWHVNYVLCQPNALTLINRILVPPPPLSRRMNWNILYDSTHVCVYCVLYISCFHQS